MGRYTDALSHRIRSRKVAGDIRHPGGYKGMVMWCSLCRGEMFRSPATRPVSTAAQKAALDRHMLTCPLRHMPRPSNRVIERGARRIMRAALWHRWRWRVLAALVVIAAALCWWQVRSL